MGSGSCRPYPLADEATTVPAVQCVSEEPWLALGLQRQLWSRGCTTAHASSSKPSARGMLCPAGLLLVHKHAATANATQSQRGYLPAGRPAGQQGSCKVKRSEIGPTGVLYSWIFRQSKEHPRPATPSRAAAAAAPKITRSLARELVRAEARSAANKVMCDTMGGTSDQRGEPE